MDKTDLLVILDRSGSMESAREDHIGGLRSFIRDQKQLQGDVYLTLVQFDTSDPCEVLIDRQPMAAIDETRLDLLPRGGTPLCDAIGLAVTHLESQLAGQQRDQIVVLVITDGLENSSREFSKASIKSLIERREKEKWKFLYLGASLDSFAEAAQMGVASSAAMVYDCGNSAAVKASYAACSRNTKQAREELTSGKLFADVVANYSFTDEQRAAARQGVPGPPNPPRPANRNEFG